MAALEIANEARALRAQLKRDLKADRASIGELLLDPPAFLQTAKVFDMLLALPKGGRECQSRQDHERLPHLAQQDVQRPQRPPTRRTRRAPEPVVAPPRPHMGGLCLRRIAVAWPVAGRSRRAEAPAHTRARGSLPHPRESASESFAPTAMKAAARRVRRGTSGATAPEPSRRLLLGETERPDLAAAARPVLA